jgi:hypothetical protein
MAKTNFNFFDIGACNCGPPAACNVTVCVAAPCTTDINAPGLPVTVTNSGGTVVASGTTGSNGCVSLTLPEAGTYKLSATDANGDVATATQAVACGSTVNLAFPGETGFMVCANTTGSLVCTVTNFMLSGTPIALTEAQSTFDLELMAPQNFWQGGPPSDLTNPLFGFSVNVFTNACGAIWGFSDASDLEINITSFTCNPFTIIGTFAANISGTPVSGTVTITL